MLFVGERAECSRWLLIFKNERCLPFISQKPQFCHHCYLHSGKAGSSEPGTSVARLSNGYWS